MLSANAPSPNVPSVGATAALTQWTVKPWQNGSRGSTKIVL